LVEFNDDGNNMSCANQQWTAFFYIYLFKSKGKAYVSGQFSAVSMIINLITPDASWYAVSRFRATHSQLKSVSLCWARAVFFPISSYDAFRTIWHACSRPWPINLVCTYLCRNSTWFQDLARRILGWNLFLLVDSKHSLSPFSLLSLFMPFCTQDLTNEPSILYLHTYEIGLSFKT
jgi:hypothetical protein